MSLKARSRAFVVASLLWWGCFWFLTNHYDATRPTLSDDAAGRSYSLNSHGHVVYLNRSEALRMYGSVFLAVTCFVLGFLIDRKSQSNV